MYVFDGCVARINYTPDSTALNSGGKYVGRRWPGWEPPLKCWMDSLSIRQE
jgi:hypothetical protein